MSDNDLIFGDLVISGFLSYPPHKPQKIDLNTNRLTAIVGTILDAPAGERNGAGKTAIIDALQYLYFGRTTRMPNKGFVNYVERGPLLVSGWAQRNGITFQVQRGENPSILRLWERPTNDHRDLFDLDGSRYTFETTKATKPETTKRIGELLGFDLKLTEVLLVNNPNDNSCYFMKTQEEQRDIQERIFGFTTFTEKADRLRELRKEENRNLASKEAAFIATRQANDRILARITEMEEQSQQWAADRDRTARFLTQQISTYDGIKFDLEAKEMKEREAAAAVIKQVEFEAVSNHRAAGEATLRFQTWDRKRHADIEAYRERIGLLMTIDANRDIETMRTRDRLRQELAQVDARITGYEGPMLGLRKVLFQGMETAKSIQKQIEEIGEKIVSLDESKCPTCGQDWADTQEHLTHCIAELDKLEKDHTKLNEQLEETNGDLTVLQDDCNEDRVRRDKLIAETQALPKLHFTSIEEASSASASREQMIARVTEMEAETNPHTAERNEAIGKRNAAQKDLESKTAALAQRVEQTPATFDSLEALQIAQRNYETVQAQFTEIQKNENPYRSSIDSLRTQAMKDVDEAEIRAIKNRVEHMSLLITLLADKDSPIRKSVLNEWLPELNMRINRYLGLLELPHKVRFDTDMTATFTDRGTDLTFFNLSAGQRLRAWLGTNMAFREIFELINYRINLFFVDEVLDKGMSARGAEVAHNVLSEMVREDKSIFLITHRAELTDMVDHILHVEMQNGLTTLRN